MICKCPLDNFLMEGNGRISYTSIPYIRPEMQVPKIVLLRSVRCFVEEFQSENWKLKVRFLINFGGRIKNQSHRWVVGDWREILICFYHHIRTAKEALPTPLILGEIKETIVSLKEVLVQLIQSDEPY